MRALHCVTAESEPLAVCVSSQLSDNTLTAGSTAQNIRVAQPRTRRSARAKSPRFKAEFRTAFAALGMSIVSACTSWQAQENTLGQISTLEQMRYSQLLQNLANQIDRRDSIPSLAVTSSGTATASLNGGFTFTLMQLFDFTHNTKILTPSATANWQNNWTISPISDPQDLQNLRALYGLLYRDEYAIARFIAETLIPYSYSSTNGSINFDDLTNRRTDCGINWNTSGKTAEKAFKDALYDPKGKGFTITDPGVALNAYFDALAAFPSKTAPTQCFKTIVAGTGITNADLANTYGLLSPTREHLLTSLRNGYSPDCRNYQLKNLQLGTEVDKIFERWLFWRDSDGNWQPQDELPPDVFPDGRQPLPLSQLPKGAFEPLGSFRNHDFWTTASACVSDFIILGINATANSHAAAQNSQKGGPTSALSGQ
jgi:hypothetical protein